MVYKIRCKILVVSSLKIQSPKFLAFMRKAGPRTTHVLKYGKIRIEKWWGIG